MGSAYNFRRAVEQEGLKVINMTNFTVALALQAAAMGVPFLPTRSALGSETTKGNHFFYQIISPFEPKETLWAVRALAPDVTIVHVQRADCEGNAHCWGNFGVMLEGMVCAAKRTIALSPKKSSRTEIIASDPKPHGDSWIPGKRGGRMPLGPSLAPVQGYYKRDDAFFRSIMSKQKRNRRPKLGRSKWVHEFTGPPSLYESARGRAKIAVLRRQAARLCRLNLTSDIKICCQGHVVAGICLTRQRS